MLVRCEKCNSVLPDTATKCFACGCKYTPPPPELELTKTDSESEQKGWWQRQSTFGKVCSILLFGGFVMCIGAFILGGIFENDVSNSRTMGIVLVCVVCVGGLAMLITLIMVCCYPLLQKSKRKRSPYEVDDAEYEQRIRDFINQ